MLTQTHAGQSARVASTDWRTRTSQIFSEALGASSLSLIVATGSGLLGADRGLQGWLSVGALFTWGALRAAKIL